MRKPSVQLNILDAIQKRDEGIQKAVQHADDTNSGWSERAYAYFIQWLAVHPRGHRFLVEDFRADAARAGLPNPPSARAFGGIVRNAVRDKLIEHAGYGKTKNVKAHLTPASVWQKV